MSNKPRVLIFIVCYNAQEFINHVLDQIPNVVWENDQYNTETLVIDDQSQDNTFHIVAAFKAKHPDHKITVLYNPKNQGYGGNQKLGYHFAVKNQFDVVVLLHGDGQYPAAMLDQMISPIINNKADVVLGSRMVNKMDALRGKMPIYKWLGNLLLTRMQNWILGGSLSEYHTGYRAYRVSALAQIPFEYNSNYFDFDTDILIQMMDTHQRFREIAIPTHYGEEISHVNSIRYGMLILSTSIRSRVMRLGLFYDRRFDYDTGVNEYYNLKLGYSSSHQFALDRVKPNMRIFDIGSGPGYIAQELSGRGVKVISLDRHITSLCQEYSESTIETDVESYSFTQFDQPVEQIWMLDIIEHLQNPEEILLSLRSQFGGDAPPYLLLTTGNIGFLPLRVGLLVGQFNYGKRGILDRDHQRLFTFQSLRSILNATGFEVVEQAALPAPFPEAIGNTKIARFLLWVNQALNKVSPGLFAYQIAYVARPLPTIDYLLERAKQSSLEKMKQDPLMA